MIKRVGRGADLSAALAEERLGAVSVVFFVMSAAAPLTVVAGTLATAFAVTGSLGLPAAFAAVGCVLGLFAVGYVAMSRHLPHSGALYAYVAHGLGRTGGVAAAWVSLLSYNLIQVCLYGAIGAAVSPLLAGTAAAGLPWWVFALVAWALVALLGVPSWPSPSWGSSASSPPSSSRKRPAVRVGPFRRRCTRRSR
ncbi:MAG TPA: hypothetical protein VI248_27565 [Kineosporiaceae bacterium]